MTGDLITGRLSRRRVLAGALATVGPATWPRLAFGAAPGDPLLVLVFLRGGCDGLLLAGPANEPGYVEARPPDLRVLDAGDRAGLPLAHPLGKGLDFRLHPDAAGLAELYRHGHLAIVHAAGLPGQTRSHQMAQSLIEAGLGGPSAAPLATGWAARWLRTLQHPAGGFSATAGLAEVLAGDPDALAAPDLAGGLAVGGGDPVRGLLGALYAEGSRFAAGPVGLAGRQALAAIDRIEARLPREADGRLQPYRPDGGAYESTDIARSLQSVARLAKLDLGLAFAAVDLVGWDHHDGQPGRFAYLLGQMSRALAQFWNDMARLHDRLTVVVMTEFGRQVRANRSGGTDHGHGGAMLVLGGRVRGGRMYGTWPGLSVDALDDRVSLAVTTDYRAVLAELMAARPGHGLTEVLPGYAWPGPLGLIAA